jgi:hypothetical protein
MDEKLLEQRAQQIKSVVLLEITSWDTTDEDASKVLLRASRLLSDLAWEIWDRILAHKE